jgi:hypothetical protein
MRFNLILKVYIYFMPFKQYLQPILLETMALVYCQLDKERDSP